LLIAAFSLLPLTAFGLAIADLLVIGFFFMLRPGEYVFHSDQATPFRLQDVSFGLPNARTINATVITEAELATATTVNLLFTTQKNGVRGETITHGDTTDPRLSPVQAVARRVCHLRQNNAPPDSPLFLVYDAGNQTRLVSSTDLTKTLRAACTLDQDTLGIAASDISARALRAGGAMALLRANVDSSTIRLLGRWQSWQMLTYLHRSATDTSSYASKMLHGGHFTLQRHAGLPQDVVDLLAQFPTPV
jgi:hypothetical protein